MGNFDRYSKKQRKNIDDSFFIISQFQIMSSTVRCYQLNQSQYRDLFSSQLIYLFSLFNESDYSIRIVGGAVRDILLGVAPHDIDLATTATTEDMLKMIQGDSNIQLVYTRAEQFGTLTLIVGTTVRVSLEKSRTFDLFDINTEENISSDHFKTIDYSSR